MRAHDILEMWSVPNPVYCGQCDKIVPAMILTRGGSSTTVCPVCRKRADTNMVDRCRACKHFTACDLQCLNTYNNWRRRQREKGKSTKR